MATGGEFSVYQFFPDESYEAVLRFVDAETAVLQARKLTKSAGARMGTTRRVIITDGGDACVFEWKFGEGIVWPKRGLDGTFLTTEGDGS